DRHGTRARRFRGRAARSARPAPRPGDGARVRPDADRRGVSRALRHSAGRAARHLAQRTRRYLTAKMVSDTFFPGKWCQTPFSPFSGGLARRARSSWAMMARPWNAALRDELER